MVVLHVLVQLLEVHCEAVFHEGVADVVLLLGQRVDLLGHVSLRDPNQLPALVSVRRFVDEVLDCAQELLRPLEDFPDFTGHGDVVGLVVFLQLHMMDHRQGRHVDLRMFVPFISVTLQGREKGKN